MLKRTLILDAVAKVGETVSLSGWISVRRDHGKLVFFVLRDRSDDVQLVVTPEKTAVIDAAKDIRAEYAVVVEGLVKERPMKKGDGAAVISEKTTDRIEIEVTALSVVGKPVEDLPVDVSQPEMRLQLETLLNHRTAALRNPKVQAIFHVYDALLESYERTLRDEGFLEIKTPKILSAATEGGANFFKIKYFDRDAFLAQSPQFYKQAGMSAFERVFEIGSVFRAEPHYTTRHVNEYTGLDAEMGFIDSMEDVMAMLEQTMHQIFRHIGANCQAALALHGATVPEPVAIPRLRLAEAFEILKKEYGKELTEGDIDSEGERLIGEYVKQKYNSDLVFLTHYPTAARAFYSLPSPEDPKYSESFDLIFRGVEIASGSQRIHDHAQLKATLEKRGLDPAAFQDYLDIFKYGAPPHGGWGLGSERIVQKLLGLSSIKEAILYPRDVKRLAP
ncbi:MAG: aspartate--tRNA(Asn) ligase [Candidatus Moraniibacteriota bacterium]